MSIVLCFADIRCSGDAKAFLLEHVQVCAAHRSVLAFSAYWQHTGTVGTPPILEKVANRCLVCADVNYQAGRAFGESMFVVKNRVRTPTRLQLVWDAEWDVRGLNSNR